MVNDKTPASASPFSGRVIDGAGAPLRDALVEIWQADADGLYNSPAEMRGTADPNFTGWGRCPTDAETGVYLVRDDQARPRAVQGRPPDGAAYHVLDRRARHQYRPSHAHVFRRRRQRPMPRIRCSPASSTRIAGATLIAARDGNVYTFDIHLQGERETVFLDI